jgi:hypothetical protein
MDTEILTAVIALLGAWLLSQRQMSRSGNRLLQDLEILSKLPPELASEDVEKMRTKVKDSIHRHAATAIKRAQQP